MLTLSSVKEPLRTVTIGGVQYDNVSEMGRYMSGSGNSRAVVLINRNLPYSTLDGADALYAANDTGVRDVRVKLPWSSGTMTRYHMPGNYNDQSWDAGSANYVDLEVESVAEGVHTGDLVVSLPASSAEIYVFENVS